MRWPWQREASPGAPAAAEPAPPPGAASAALLPEATPSASGWAFHPPLQRTIAGAMTIHDGPAAGWTTTGRALGLTGRMTHLVSASSWSGVVDGDGKGLASVSRDASAEPPRGGPHPGAATGPVDGALTRAATTPGLPVLRYAQTPGPLPPLAEGRRSGQPGPIADLDDSLHVPTDWTNPDPQLAGGTVAAVPLGAGHPLDPPPRAAGGTTGHDTVPSAGAAGAAGAAGRRPVQRTADRRLGLGAPLASAPAASEPPVAAAADEHRAPRAPESGTPAPPEDGPPVRSGSSAGAEDHGTSPVGEQGLVGAGELAPEPASGVVQRAAGLPVAPPRSGPATAAHGAVPAPLTPEPTSGVVQRAAGLPVAPPRSGPGTAPGPVPIPAPAAPGGSGDETGPAPSVQTHAEAHAGTGTPGEPETVVAPGGTTAAAQVPSRGVPTGGGEPPAWTGQPSSGGEDPGEPAQPLLGEAVVGPTPPVLSRAVDPALPPSGRTSLPLTLGTPPIEAPGPDRSGVELAPPVAADPRPSAPVAPHPRATEALPGPPGPEPSGHVEVPTPAVQRAVVPGVHVAAPSVLPPRDRPALAGGAAVTEARASRPVAPPQPEGEVAAPLQRTGDETSAADTGAGAFSPVTASGTPSSPAAAPASPLSDVPTADARAAETLGSPSRPLAGPGETESPALALRGGADLGSPAPGVQRLEDPAGHRGAPAMPVVLAPYGSDSGTDPDHALIPVPAPVPVPVPAPEPVASPPHAAPAPVTGTDAAAAVQRATPVAPAVQRATPVVLAVQRATSAAPAESEAPVSSEDVPVVGHATPGWTGRPVDDLALASTGPAGSWSAALPGAHAGPTPGASVAPADVAGARTPAVGGARPLVGHQPTDVAHAHPAGSGPSPALAAVSRAATGALAPLPWRTRPSRLAGQAGLGVTLPAQRTTGTLAERPRPLLAGVPRTAPRGPVGAGTAPTVLRAAGLVAAVPERDEVPLPAFAPTGHLRGRSAPDREAGSVSAVPSPLAHVGGVDGLPTTQRAFAPGQVSSLARRRRLLGDHRRGAPLPLSSPVAVAAPEAPPAVVVAEEPPQEPPAPVEETVTEDGPAAVESETVTASARPGAAMDPAQLAGLVDALVPPLLRRMRHEILLDRERRGLRTDRRLP